MIEVKKYPIPLTHRLYLPNRGIETLSNMLIGKFFLRRACKSDMEALDAFLLKLRAACLRQPVLKYDTEIFIFINLFQLFPIDVKVVISSSIFAKNNELRFFILIFKPHLMVYLCSLERQSCRSLRYLQSNRRSSA